MKADHVTSITGTRRSGVLQGAPVGAAIGFGASVTTTCDSRFDMTTQLTL